MIRPWIGGPSCSDSLDRAAPSSSSRGSDDGCGHANRRRASAARRDCDRRQGLHAAVASELVDCLTSRDSSRAPARCASIVDGSRTRPRSGGGDDVRRTVRGTNHGVHVAREAAGRSPVRFDRRLFDSVPQPRQSGSGSHAACVRFSIPCSMRTALVCCRQHGSAFDSGSRCEDPRASAQKTDP